MTYDCVIPLMRGKSPSDATRMLAVFYLKAFIGSNSFSLP